jgi:hypothetical protein
VTTGQGDGQQFTRTFGLFWPQGDPVKLGHAAQAWRDMGRALAAAEGACHSATNLVTGCNEGPAIDAFSHYWGKWEGGEGYFQLSSHACEQIAQGLDRYAAAIDHARQRVEEIAATAATVLAVGVALTVVTGGISDGAAAAGEAALTAAAAAVGVELSATVLEIGGTLIAGAIVGMAASAVIDTAVQIEHIEVFHDQQSFDWGELGHSVEIGGLTGGAGAGLGLGARALAPALEDALPGFRQAANAFGRTPLWMQSGIRGTLVGGGVAAGMDQLTSGQVNPLDVALGSTGGAVGDMVGTGQATAPTESSAQATQRTAGSVRNVNPGFPGPGRVENCTNCAVATDAMLAGRPASALPGGVASLFRLEAFYQASFEPAGGQAEIEMMLQNAGPGSRGIVFGGRQGMPGHVFNAVNQGGVVRFLDGQVGGVASFKGYDYLMFLWTHQ